MIPFDKARMEKLTTEELRVVVNYYDKPITQKMYQSECMCLDCSTCPFADKEGKDCMGGDGRIEVFKAELARRENPVAVLEREVAKLKEALDSVTRQLQVVVEPPKPEVKWITNPQILCFGGSHELACEYKETKASKFWSKGGSVCGKSTSKGKQYKVKKDPHTWAFKIRVTEEDYEVYLLAYENEVKDILDKIINN